jgi:hypothetical protein
MFCPKTIVNSGHTPETFRVQRFNNDLLRNDGNSNETHVWRVYNILEGAFEAFDHNFIGLYHCFTLVQISR